MGAAKGGLYGRCVYKRTKCTPAFFFLFLWSEIAFTTDSVRLTFRLMEKSASGTDTRQAGLAKPRVTFTTVTVKSPGVQFVQQCV